MTASWMTRFGVKNYKCLKDVDIPLTPIHVIIGQNDAGKTSLLEAMYAYFRSTKSRISNAFPGRWKNADLVNEAAKIPIVEFEGEFNYFTTDPESTVTGKYGFQVDFSKQNPAVLREWHAGTDAKRIEFNKQSSKSTRVSQGLDAGGSVEELAYLMVFAQCLESAHFYQFEPKLMATPATIEPIRKFRMDSDGFGLPTLLDDIVGFAAERFIELRKRFCEYFPQYRTVRIEVQDAIRRQYNETGIVATGNDSGKGIVFETQQGRSISAQQASDGAVLFLGFLALTMLPKPPKLILIEEPENGVYPKRLKEIVDILREIVINTPEESRPQVIFSTHSPYLLSFFQPEEVTFMSRHEDGVVARPLRDAPNIKERMDDEFYLGELWYNLSEEELFGDVVAQSN